MPRVVNVLKILKNISLKKLITDEFNSNTGKFFYSIEVSPSDMLTLDFEEFNTLPLFVGITWLKDKNLHADTLKNSPAFKLTEEIKSSYVVNNLTCYKLESDHVKEVLKGSKLWRSFMVLGGDHVDVNQTFKYAADLVKEIRKRSVDDVTLFVSGYPEGHFESPNLDGDLRSLKYKVECGSDVIITQVVFSAEMFVAFVKRCREVGISSEVTIIPGLYIPRNWNELNLILNITKVSLPHEVHERLKELKEDEEKFKSFSLDFTLKIIEGIRLSSPEFISGFHFFTMNNFEMIHRLTESVNFSEVP